MKRKEAALPGLTFIVPFLLIAVVSILSYSNTFQVPFQLDDSLNISSKPYVKDIGVFLDPAKIEHYRDDDPFRMRMVAYFTFAVNYLIHGNEVAGYHVFNLAVHILNGFLVYFLVLLTLRTPYFAAADLPSTQKPPLLVGDRGTLPEGGTRTGRSGPRYFIPLFAALLFVSHPVQTEAVTYIVQRIASLATFFYLLSLFAYIMWRLKRSGKPWAGKEEIKSGRPAVWYLSSFVAAVLAMKTKEFAFTLPLTIVLYELLFFTGPLRKRGLYLVPFLLTLLIIPLELMGLEKPAGAVMGEMNSVIRAQSDLSRLDYLFTQFRVIVTYIRLLFIPVNQNLDYDYPVYHSFSDPNVFLSFLFLMASLGLGVYLLYRSRTGNRGGQRENSLKTNPYSHLRLIAFGIFWFFLTLSIESGIIPIADVIFEHRLYLPSVGVFISVAAGGFLLYERAADIGSVWPKMVVGALVLIILVFAGATYARNTRWSDEVKLWEDVAEKSPSKVRPRINLGYFYGKQGRLAEALREYQIALKLAPDDFQVHDNLGVVYKAEGRIAEAIEEYRTALRLNPRDAMAYYNLGNIFRERGDFGAAILQYQTAIRLEPETEVAVIHNNLGIAYIGAGKVKEAEQEFRTALDLDPDYEPARRNLEKLLGRGGL